MSKVHQYQIFCVTEDATIQSEEWRTAPITTCPHNAAHTVKADSVSIATSKEQFSVFFAGDYDGNYSNYRVRNVGGNSNFRFNFCAPHDFGELVELKLVGIVDPAAAGADKNIDLSSEYAHADEAYNTHSESSTTNLYDLTGKGDKLHEFDIANIFTGLEPGHYCAVYANHNNIGGYIRYIGIRMIYNVGEDF